MKETNMDLSQRNEHFEKACESGQKLFAEKNSQYGDSIVNTGVLGAGVELVGLAGRVKKLVIKSGDGGEASRDALIDILKDIHNYANIALLMLAEDNWTGV
jgi:hypothetical protein